MEQFPAGLRVLVVDDDRTCLMILEKMLRNCAYNVTTCGTARVALAMLREKRQCYDLVISDVYMPDMDGFKLLELVGLEMDLPVIMMSADGETSVVMKGITHGACDYLIKPIRIKELRNIWQHVIRKRRSVFRDVENAHHQVVEHERSKHRRQDDGENALLPSARKRKEQKEDEEDELDAEDATSLKKPRVVWSVELHQQFVTAVNQLGIDKAVPKRILELMHVQGLTRENVASHLQKYRLYLKRLSVAHQQSTAATMAPTFDLQSHTVVPPGSPQSLAAIQSAYLARSSVVSAAPVEPAPVFVIRPRLPPSSSQQRTIFPGISDLDHLGKSYMPPAMGTGPDGIADAQARHLLTAANNGTSNTTTLTTSLADQMLQQQQQQQQQMPHYVHSVDFTPAAKHDSGIMHPALLDDNKALNVATRPPVKCEPDSLPGSSWSGYSQLAWQPQQQQQQQQQQQEQQQEQPQQQIMVQNAAVPAFPLSGYGKPGSELLHSQGYISGFLGHQQPQQQVLNQHMKVKEEQLFNAVPASGFPAEQQQQQQMVDDLSSVCYKQDHESGYFAYNELLGMEGYISGNLYVK